MEAIDGKDLLTCGSCGNTAELDNYDCMGMPDGVLVCNACGDHVSAETGEPIQD